MPINDNRDEDMRIFFGSLKDYHMIGQCFIYLDSLANLLETINDGTPIIDTKGNINGKLFYSIIPRLSNNDEGMESKLLLYENINELIGQSLTVTFQLHGARDLPPKYATDVYLSYKWVDENQEDYNTEKTKSGMNDIHP